MSLRLTARLTRDPRHGQDVFVTRLHARCNATSFPEDLRQVETGDRSNFQGRYILRHASTGEMACEAGEQYRQSRLPERDANAASSNWSWWSLRRKPDCPTNPN